MKNKHSLKQYYQQDKLEVGLDEAGRGCLLGPVCVAGVIWLDKDPREDIIIKDSKKYSEKKRTECYDYIKENCIAYSIQMLSNEDIDYMNKSFLFFCFFVLRFCYINILFSSLPVMQGVMRHVHNAQIQMAIGVDGICYAVPACFDSLGKIP